MRRCLTILVAGLVAGLALAGCTIQAPLAVAVMPLNRSPRPVRPRDPMSVELYTTARPARPYVEISSFTASSGDGQKDMADMRVEAGTQGCDALLMIQISTHFNMQSTGTCVVWSDAASLGVMPPPAAPAPAPAPAPPQ